MIKRLPAPAVICGLLLAEVPVIAATTYQATWASVDTHTPAPEWFKDAKFGIYFHWGAFSVPAYFDEWYPRRIYDDNDPSSGHQRDTYGDPKGDWGYQYFILGKQDKQGNWTQFAPKLKSAGGNFDPDEWAQLFADAGAKFAGSVMEHHDGFSMWDSKVNEWNSVSKGPELDLAKLFSTSIRKKNLKFLSAMHHAYHFNGFYEFVPSQSADSLKKLFGQMGATAENQLWYDKLKEVIDQYQPDIIWEDFDLNKVDESKRLAFLSYYYNQANAWGKEVVATYKDGYDNQGEVLDYERGGPGDLSYPYWLSDDAISSSSWCYTNGIGYYSSTQILHRLIDLVSKNGNLLLNISPMADGTIPQAQRDVLHDMGDWLGKFGSSIYGTRAWSVYGEGPTKMGGGSFTNPVAGTSSDIRYTRAKNNSAVYAILLGWPGNGTMVTMAGLSSSKLHLTAQTKVQLIGSTPGTDVNLTYTQDADGLKVTFPASTPYTALAYPVRVLLTSDTSVGLPMVSVYKDDNFAGFEAQLPEGSYTKSQLTALGVADNDVSSMQVDAGLTVELFDDDNFQTPLGTYTSDQANFETLGINDKVTSMRISKTASGLRSHDGAVAGKLGRIQWSRGVLLLPGTGSGRVQIVDSRGNSRVVDVVGGRGYTGVLPGGVYQVRPNGESALGAERFLVVP
jgi:alpha-L-fucosidase